MIIIYQQKPLFLVSFKHVKKCIYTKYQKKQFFKTKKLNIYIGYTITINMEDIICTLLMAVVQYRVILTQRP